MFSNKVQTNEYNIRSDSFADRFCDDLSEFILQFLPLEDKLTLESVSKQFQRTLFHYQTNLAIDETIYGHNLEVLLQKLPPLSSIKFRNGSVDLSFEGQQLTEQTVELIIKYCNNLKYFNIHFLRFVRQDIQMKFFKKFGHKLVKIDANTHLLWALNETPNVEELTLRSEYGSIDSLPIIELKRLKKLNLRFFDLKQIEVFIERNAKTITHLDIGFITPENSELIQTILSKVKNLVHLKISSGFATNDLLFVDQLSRIEVKCNQLKSLTIDYKLYQFDDHFITLRQFKRLKRLELQFMANYTYSKDNLSKIAETIFKDLDINFPKLQSLKIKGMEVNITEETVLMLSRMTALKSIELSLLKKKFIPDISSLLTNNCKSLHKISLK